MKWLCVCLSVIGTLAPTGVLYAVNFDRRVPGAIIDLGLLFYSLGLSIIFIPIGLGSGVVLAIIIHLIWNRLPGRTNNAGRQFRPGSSWIIPPQTSSVETHQGSETPLK